MKINKINLRMPFKRQHIKHISQIILSSLVISALTTVPYLSNYLMARQVMAQSLTQAKLTISDSRAAATNVTHEFKFTTATGGAIKSVDFQYCTTSAGACSQVTGLNFASAGTGTVVGLSAGTLTSNSTTLTYTVTNAATIGSGTAITIPFTNITNPSGTNSSFYVRVTTKDASSNEIDRVSVASAVLTTTSIAVSASVGAAFTFVVAGVASGSVNGRSIDITTTENTIPFGSLSNDDEQVGAHDVTVNTNATNGYSVTVKALSNPPLTDGNNNIDIFTGTNASPATWTAAPAGSTSNVNTGYFGYTTEDADLSSGTINRFTSSGGNKWAGTSTSPEELIYNPTGTSGGGQTTRIGWMAEVNSFQPAGDYTGTVILVATPTY